MKPLISVASLLCLVHRHVDQVSAKIDVIKDESAQLKISVRRDTLEKVSSCQHTFSQVELQNMHETEPITINSIRTISEKTIMIHSENGDTLDKTWGSEQIPRQLHVSRLPSGKIFLGPARVAIVPVTFLPRYPDFERDSLDSSNRDKKTPPEMSSTARADLSQLVGQDILDHVDFMRYSGLAMSSSRQTRRSNLDPSVLPDSDEFQVTSHIVIESSRGTVKVPIPASTVRRNTYGIPDVIQFRHSRYVDERENFRYEHDKRSSKDPSAAPKLDASIDEEGDVILMDSLYGTKEEMNEPEDSGDDGPGRDCYDLFLANPHDKDVEVTQALLSRPRLMSLEFNPARMLTIPESDPVETAPSQVIRRWTRRGPLILPANSDDNYIATICTTNRGVPNDKETFEYLQEMTNWIDSGRPRRSLGFLEIKVGEYTLFIGLERAKDMSSEHPKQIAAQNSPPVRDESISDSSALIRSSPEQVSFHLIPSANPAISEIIGLHNKSPVPIRIMRVTVGMNASGNNKRQHILAKKIGLKMKVDVGNKEESDSADKKQKAFMLPPLSSVKSALILSCSVDWDASSIPLKDTSFRFTGAVVVRGTMDTGLNRAAWREEMKRNPYKDFHLVTEVPYSIFILNGRVKFSVHRSTHPYPQMQEPGRWDRKGESVSALYFPMHRVYIPSNPESNLPSQDFTDSGTIEHELLVTSNMPASLTVRGAAIYSEIETDDSLCARFRVEKSPKSLLNANSTQSGDKILGLLKLGYAFGKQQDASAEIFEAPVMCYLRISTDPVHTGEHRIPLFIYSGRLIESDPRLTQSEIILAGGTGSAEVRANSATAMSLDQLAVWLSSTHPGSSLLDAIGSSKLKPGRLKEYFFRLAGLKKSSKRIVRPIVIQAGAVVRGQAIQSPLYFTNYNPVPVSLSFDASEANGISIALGQDTSRTRGDGNSILDFLPKPSLVKKEPPIVLGGKFDLHPLEGLREFLLTSEASRKFFSQFSFRDSLSSVEKPDPVLRRLHRRHSYAEFRRRQVSRSHKAKSCDGVKSQSVAVGQIESVQGPIVVLGRSDVRKLPKCSQNKTTHATFKRNRVQIAPGGSARLDLIVRATGKNLLEDRDITDLLSIPGITLTSDHGHVIPVLLSYQVLQGQLHVSSPSYNQPREIGDTKDPTVMEPPLELFRHPDPWNSSALIVKPMYESQIPNTNDVSTTSFRNPSQGIFLYMQSTFKRDIHLLSIESCNPWFEVTKRDGRDNPDGLGVFLGTLRNAVDCHLSEYDGDISSPTYYSCALQWMNYSALQSDGCGTLSPIANPTGDAKLGSSRVELNRASKAFDRARRVVGKLFERERDRLSISRDVMKHDFTPRDGYLPLSVVDAFAESWEAWKIASESGLGYMSSSLRATVSCDNPNATSEADGSGVQKLTLPIQNMAMRASIAPPRLHYIDQVSQSNSSLLDHDQFGPSILRFPSTPIASVSSRTISVRNPTSVPIQVRLSAMSQSVSGHTRITGVDSFSIDDSTRNRFVHSYDAPFMQNGKQPEGPAEIIQHLWWSGSGSYFMSDGKGNMVRSQQNVSIRAGPGAHVSLVNPSLHASIAFLVGCGLRCGVRDEAQSTGDDSVLNDSKDTSPIGASAVAGVTLLGQKRSNVPEMNAISADEPFVLAGNSPLLGTAGPAAYAIPYSSLQTVVVPPYGEAEVGPVWFRPPGHTRLLGVCDSAVENDIIHMGAKTADACSSGQFEAMVFLENSLTGIERVVLRGEGIREQLIFLDPPPGEGEDSFGEIELRHGKPTLLFSGGAGPPNGFPLMKEVLLHNDGDLPIDVSSIRISSALRHPGIPESQSATCDIDGFSLRNCVDSQTRFWMTDHAKVHNVWNGFELMPGENQTLFVEHAPDCATPEGYVKLTARYDSREPSWTEERDKEIFDRVSRAKKMRGTKHVELLLGYSMDKIKFSECTQAKKSMRSSAPGSPYFSSGASHRKFQQNHRRLRSSSNLAFFRSTVINRLMVLIPVSSMVLILFAWMFGSWSTRARHLGSLSMMLLQSSQQPEDRTNLPSQEIVCSNRQRVFRCLARADPSSMELQALSREQTRQVIISRYRAANVLTQHCFNNTGTFHRERSSQNSNGSARQRSGKEGAAGSDKVRMISDAIFASSKIASNAPQQGLLPINLGWRAAFSRGVVSKASISAPGQKRKTNELAYFRAHGTTQAPKMVEGKSDAKTTQKESTRISSPPQVEMKARIDETEDYGLRRKFSYQPKHHSPGQRTQTNVSQNSVAKEEVQVRESRSASVDKEPIESHKDIKTNSESRDVPTDEVTTTSAVLVSLDRETEHVEDQSVHSHHVTVQSPNESEHYSSELRSPSIRSSATSPHATENGEEEELPPELIFKTSPGQMKKLDVLEGMETPPQVTRQKRTINRSPAHTSDLLQTPRLFESPMRPPPGLRPPPGFRGESPQIPVSRLEASPFVGRRSQDTKLAPMLNAVLMNPDADLDDMLSLARPEQNGDDNLFPSEILASLTTPQLYTTPHTTGSSLLAIPVSAIPAPPLGSNSVAPPPAHDDYEEPNQLDLTIPMSPLLSNRTDDMEGFDVMDFLDSILNDGSAEEDPSAVANSSVVPVLSNPWASNEGTSRATAYGISEYDDDSEVESGSNDSGGDVFGGPLLTPAALLSDDYE